MKHRLPKPTLQKLNADDDVEHLLETFERIVKQQNWPEEVWPTQLVGLLTGKTMAAHVALSMADSTDYLKVKTRDFEKVPGE